MKKEGGFLSDSELTHMLYNIVDAGAHLQKNGISHGDITPYNISVESPSSYKLMENFGDLARPQQSQQEKILSSKNHFTSPEKYKNILSGNVNAPINPSKNDVFGLGASILEVGNASSLKDIYNPDGSINVQILEQHKGEFAKKHQAQNNLLVSTVHSMVEVNPVNRPDFIEIQQQLPSYNEVKQFLNQRETEAVTFNSGEVNKRTTQDANQNVQPVITREVVEQPTQPVSAPVTTPTPTPVPAPASNTVSYTKPQTFIPQSLTKNLPTVSKPLPQTQVTYTQIPTTTVTYTSPIRTQTFYPATTVYQSPTRVSRVSYVSPARVTSYANPVIETYTSPVTTVISSPSKVVYAPNNTIVYQTPGYYVTRYN